MTQTKKEAEAEVDRLSQEAAKLLAEATRLANQHGITFYFTSGNGYGEENYLSVRYDGYNEWSPSSDWGWVHSSFGC